MIQDVLIAMPMFVCGIFSVQLLLSLFRKHDTARGWLTVWAFVATVLYGCHFVFFHHVVRLMPVSDTVYVVCNLSVYPLYLIYICVLTEMKWPRWMMGVLAVAVAAGAVVGGLYALMTPAETERFVRAFLYQEEEGTLAGTLAAQVVVHRVLRVMFAAEVVWVVIAGTRKIRQYNELVRSMYVDTEDKTLGHISVLLWLLIVTSGVSLVANAVGRNCFSESVWLLAVPSLCFSALLFGIGWTGLWQQFSMSDMLKDEQAAPAEKPCAETETAGQSMDGDGKVVLKELKEQLERVVQEEQLFLRQGLKLDELTQRLGTNRTYLLQALREELHMSFSEYINRLRVAYAERLMVESPGLSKEDIANQSGYTSLSSFYRNLRQYGNKR